MCSIYMYPAFTISKFRASGVDRFGLLNQIFPTPNPAAPPLTDSVHRNINIPSDTQAWPAVVWRRRATSTAPNQSTGWTHIRHGRTRTAVLHPQPRFDFDTVDRVLPLLLLMLLPLHLHSRYQL